MIKAVIFDWGGVIAPNPHGGWVNVLADMLGSTVNDLLPHWHAAEYEKFSSGLIDEAQFWAQFEKSYGKPLPNNLNRVWIDGSALQPWEDAMEFIDKIHSRGIITAILSNTVKPLSLRIHQEALYDGFHTVVLSDEVGLCKQDENIYRLVLERLVLRVDECLYIDDLPKNLVPANQLGMKTILAKNPTQMINDVELAFRVYN